MITFRRMLIKEANFSSEETLGQLVQSSVSKIQTDIETLLAKEAEDIQETLGTDTDLDTIIDVIKKHVGINF